MWIISQLVNLGAETQLGQPFDLIAFTVWSHPLAINARGFIRYSANLFSAAQFGYTPSACAIRRGALRFRAILRVASHGLKHHLPSLTGLQWRLRPPIVKLDQPNRHGFRHAAYSLTYYWQAYK